MAGEIPGWFNKELAGSLNAPIEGTYAKSSKRVRFGKQEFEEKFCKLFYYKHKTNLFKFPKVEISENKFDALNLKKTVNKISKIKNKHSPKYKALLTKQKNLIKIIAGITKTTKYEIYPTNSQESKLLKWFTESEKCYNKCVDTYDENSDLFDNSSYKDIKIDIFAELYGGEDKGCPYDTLTDEVRKFCSNLKSCKTNLENGNIVDFNIKYLNSRRDTRTIFIPKTAIKDGAIFVTHLGQMKGLEEIENVERDCTLTYSKKRNKFWLNVPMVCERINIKNREKICAIDPGEATFISFCGENTFGDIGIYMRDRMLKERDKIGQLQKILKKGKNKNGKKLKIKAN